MQTKYSTSIYLMVFLGDYMLYIIRFDRFLRGVNSRACLMHGKWVAHHPRLQNFFSSKLTKQIHVCVRRIKHSNSIPLLANILNWCYGSAPCTA